MQISALARLDSKLRWNDTVEKLRSNITICHQGESQHLAKLHQTFQTISRTAANRSGVPISIQTPG